MLLPTRLKYVVFCTLVVPPWQVKECASRLVRLAKGSGITVFIVGHVTKSGSIAGPKVVEHMVDTVLYLEGDRFNSYRCVAVLVLPLLPLQLLLVSKH